MLVSQHLKDVWKQLGVGYMAGVFIPPGWCNDGFVNHSDTVCIARAVGYCMASHYKPVLVVLTGEYVSFQELLDAIRQALHLPIIFVFLTPIIYKLRHALPEGLRIETHTLTMRRSRPTFFYIPQEGLDKPLQHTVQINFIQDNEPPPFVMTDIHQKITQSYRPVVLLGRSITKMPTFPPIPIIVGDPDALPLVKTDHKYFIGKFGRTGDRAGNMAVQNADLVLVIGDLDWEPWYARHASILWVSLPPLAHHDHVEQYGYDPDLFLKKWHMSHNARWNDWVHVCRKWKSRWMLETPPLSLTLPKLSLYAFHALIQQHYIGLCRYVVAKQDDYFWCPLYQQMIMDDHPRRLFVRPFQDILMFACGVQEHIGKKIIVFLPQTNTLQYEHLLMVGNQQTPLIMFLIDTGKDRFHLNEDGYYDMVEDGLGLMEITNIPSVSIHLDNVYDMLENLEGLSAPIFVWVQCDGSFVPHPIGSKNRPPEEMEPDDGMTNEMIVPPIGYKEF